MSVVTENPLTPRPDQVEAHGAVIQRLGPQLLRSVGGHRFPARPMRVVVR
jgi:hypothetical protein